MSWFSGPASQPDSNRENKRLHKLVAVQKDEIAHLQRQLAVKDREQAKALLEWEREREEFQSTITIKDLELRLQAGVIERDRKRVEGELAGHMAAIAHANQLQVLRHGGQRGAIQQLNQTPPGS